MEPAQVVSRQVNNLSTVRRQHKGRREKARSQARFYKVRAHAGGLLRLRNPHACTPGCRRVRARNSIRAMSAHTHARRASPFSCMHLHAIANAIHVLRLRANAAARACTRARTQEIDTTMEVLGLVAVGAQAAGQQAPGQLLPVSPMGSTLSFAASTDQPTPHSARSATGAPRSMRRRVGSGDVPYRS